MASGLPAAPILARPEVAAATSAALGVLTPMPCLPATTSPWLPGAPQVLIEGTLALCTGSLCLCDWFGKVTVDLPGQFLASVEG